MVASKDPHGINKIGSPGKLDHQIDSWGFVHGRQSRIRLIIGAVVLGAGAVGIVVAFLLVRFGGDNFHKVSDDFYRSDQLDGPAMKRVIERNGIATVIRLVGTEDSNAESYEEESAAVAETDAKLVVAKMAATRLPYRSELSRVFEALDTSQRPLLVHCRQGSDRTGLISAIWLHDYKGESLEKAREQLAVFYGHMPVGSSTAMDDFLDMYDQYSKDHPGEKLTIQQWVKLHYFVEKPGHEIQPWHDGVMYEP
ncbi:MAG: tyrosine-protein phosphatase [Planctomycetes bacterium]|nr:tyrosine-protein phosphatase [Planctomycetota bacterium]